jgi:hypothetical protein
MSSLRSAVVTLSVVLGLAGSALAQTEVGNPKATPVEFVGSADVCGGPAGSRLVQAAWLGGIGLPDQGGKLNNDPTAAKNLRQGLLLSKNGSTGNCSAAVARITGTRRSYTVNKLGFDYRNGSHCGAGAPRFNVTTTDGRTFFVGCAHGTHTPSAQDPSEWTTVVFDDAADFFPADGGAPFDLLTNEVRKISIVYDEGTDTAVAGDASGIGLAIIDNIVINTELITSPAPSVGR